MLLQQRVAARDQLKRPQLTSSRVCVKVGEMRHETLTELEPAPEHVHTREHCSGIRLARRVRRLSRQRPTLGGRGGDTTLLLGLEVLCRNLE